MDIRTIHQQLAAGAYAPKTPRVRVRWYRDPSPLDLLTFMARAGKNMTLAQATETLTAQLKAQEAEDLADLEKYGYEEQAGLRALQDDVRRCYSMEFHPLWDALSYCAYSQGHPKGLSGILRAYEDIMLTFRQVLRDYSFVPNKDLRLFPVTTVTY